MARFTFDLEKLDEGYVGQLRYALSFASESVLSYEIDETGRLLVETKEGGTPEDQRRKIQQLIERYAQPKLGLRSEIYFSQERELTVRPAWEELVERRWITPVGQGHVIFRGLAARLFRAIDAKVVAEFAEAFEAEDEVYPSTILCDTLDVTNHFTSFPEHVDFVSHLREDVDILKQFSDLCGEEGWLPAHHETRTASPDFAISPSCCYHCYEGMRGWELEGEGRCVTAVLNCHRYEGSNLTTLSRLRSFYMREVVWIGKPKFVLDGRRRAEDALVDWAKEWELACTFETANDMFFTDDYEVKASFQRQQEAKRELRLRIPQEEISISCASSNFHAASFGKAFDIKAGKRPAVSACLGWGLERWVYAVFSQFGLDPKDWPEAIRRDLERYS